MLERLACRIYRRFLLPESRLSRLLLNHASRVRKLAFITTLLLYPIFCLLSWVRIGIRKLLRKKPAVVWAPTPIISIVDSSAVLKRLGYDSTTLVYTSYYITHQFDINLKSVMQNQGVAFWLPNVLFLWSLLRFDVFHYFYDGGIWSGMKIVPQAKWIELPLLRLAGKRVIASAFGADVRTKGENEKFELINCCQECSEPGKHCICNIGDAAVNTKYYRDWCNELIAMGDMHDYVFSSRKSFNHWPIDVQQVDYVPPRRHDGPVRLVHAPNHRFFKGTRFIEEAVGKLKQRGYNVHLDIIERVSNAEAKRRYAEADVVIAQCVVGWMGFTEIEAMAAGKPVVTYIRNQSYLDHAPECPAVSAPPMVLEAELEKLVKEPDLRRTLGEKGRRYVEKYWSYEALSPVYDELHRSVWGNNRLFETLSNKWRDFTRGETRYRVGSPLDGDRLGEWPVHSDPLLNLARIESGCYGRPAFDEVGIPRMFYNGSYVEHPGVVGLYALNRFHALLLDPQNEKHREGFHTAAKWLRDHLRVDAQGAGRWLYAFVAVGRLGKMDVPWVSCFSQAIGLSILLRAEQMFPEEGFDVAADAAARLYQVSIKEHGILCMEDGLTFLEEYPEDPPSHVLNGFITAVFALHEYQRVRKFEWAARMLEECFFTIATILPRYESARGIRYDLVLDGVVSPDYFYFIVQQLRVLHIISGQKIFLRYAKRWIRMMYKRKLALFGSLRSPI